MVVSLPAVKMAMASLSHISVSDREAVAMASEHFGLAG